MPPSPKQSHSGNSTGRRLFCWGLRLAPFSCFLTLVILWLIHFCQPFVIWGTFLIHGETQGTYARQERSLIHAIGLTLVNRDKPLFFVFLSGMFKSTRILPCRLPCYSCHYHVRYVSILTNVPIDPRTPDFLVPHPTFEKKNFFESKLNLFR